MCIKCYQRTVRYLASAIGAGAETADALRSASSHLTEAQQKHEDELIPGSAALASSLLEMTTAQTMDDDGDPAFKVSQQDAEALVAFFKPLKTDQVWWLLKLMQVARQQFDIAEDVCIDALRMRAEKGDIMAAHALGIVEVVDLGNAFMIALKGGPSGAPAPTPPSGAQLN